MREFDLQAAFPRAGALAEDIEDQPGAIDDLAPPLAFQIALLYRAERRVHDRERHVVFAKRCTLRRHLAFAQQRARPPDAQRHDRLMHDRKPDRRRKPDRLGQPRLGRTRHVVPVRPLPRQDHRGPRGRRRSRGGDQEAAPGEVSSSGSNNDTAAPGITVLTACL